MTQIASDRRSPRGVEELCSPDATWTDMVQESTPDAVLAWDLDGNLRYLNPQAARWHAQGELPSAEVLLGEFAPTRRTSRDLPRASLIEACIGDLIDSDLTSRTRILPSDGRSSGIQLSASVVRDSQSRVSGLMIACRDHQPISATVRRLVHQATHDELTSLANRRVLRMRLERLILAFHPHDRHTLMILDLDKFKIVNDTAGHAAGDAALRQVATIISGSVRTRDTVARLGGDEFCLLMEHCAPEAALGVAHNLISEVQGFRFVWDGRLFRFGISIGLVALSGYHRVADDVLREADAACYRAKRGGGDRVEVFRLTHRERYCDEGT